MKQRARHSQQRWGLNAEGYFVNAASTRIRQGEYDKEGFNPPIVVEI
jgi:hypothetical protein